MRSLPLLALLASAVALELASVTLLRVRDIAVDALQRRLDEGADA